MLKKICNISSTVIVALMAILVFILYVVNLFGIKPYTVLTGSMEPNCPVGSVVYVVDTPPEKLEIGDVVTFRLNASTVATHRIVEIRPDDGKVVTKGDSNDTTDEPTSFGAIIGKVVFVVPMLGFVAAWLSTVTGKFALTGVFVVALILMVIPDAIDKEQKKKKTAQADKI